MPTTYDSEDQSYDYFLLLAKLVTLQYVLLVLNSNISLYNEIVNSH